MFLAVGKALLVLIGSGVITATALPLLRKDAWWIRDFDFPRVQILFLCALTGATYLLVFEPGSVSDALFLVLLFASAGVQAWRIHPYTRLAGKQVLDSTRRREDMTLRLLVANVLLSNRQSGRLKKLIEDVDPDLVLTLESGYWWQQELRSLERKYPWTVRHPLDNTYGMHLFSRLEILENRIHFLIKEEVPSFEVTLRLPSGAAVRFWCVHPEPPSPTESDTSTERDAEILLVGRRVRRLDLPVMVAGDLNDVAWSRTTRLFQQISGLLDPRIGRGRFSTFHARYPFLRWPLDHIFHSDHFRLIDLRVLPGFGSDHFPILAALSLEPRKWEEQEEPSADPQERERVQEKIRKAREG